MTGRSRRSGPAAAWPVELTSERLVLRLAAAADAPAVVHFFRENQDHLGPFEPERPEGFFTERFWRSRIAASRREFREDRSLRLFLFDRAGDEDCAEVLGTVNFTQFVRGGFHCCSLGYSLAEHVQGRGLMREALGIAIPHVFGTLGFHRIQANYMPHNRRSGATLRALDFVVEGYARDYLRINGRWEDHLLTSLTNAAWRATEGRSEPPPGGRPASG